MTWCTESWQKQQKGVRSTGKLCKENIHVYLLIFISSMSGGMTVTLNTGCARQVSSEAVPTER